MSSTAVGDALTASSLSNEPNASPAGTATQQEQESSVGITSFVSADVEGFTCVYKQRYTDFQVNEISLNEEVVHLTDIASNVKKEKPQPEHPDSSFEQPEENKLLIASNSQKRALDLEDTEEDEPKRRKTDSSFKTETSEPQSATLSREISQDDRTALSTIFGEDVTTSILKLYDDIVAHPMRKAKDHDQVRTEVIESKEIRTQAHMAIRRTFESKLESLTLQEDPGRMMIKAAPPQKPGQARPENARSDGQRRKKQSWHELGGEYLHFTLYKENKDTMEVLYFLASQLKLKVNHFQFAGTKDRRGVTVQRVAVHKLHKERVIGVTKLARNWRIGQIEYKKHGLMLGDLKGNEFVVALRNCQLSTDVDDKLAAIRERAQRSAETLNKNGFVNFYGLQRFGSFTTGTHTTGMKMLQGRLEEAVDGILYYDPALVSPDLSEEKRSTIPRDDLDRARAISTWRETGDAHKARDIMPRRFNAEISIVQALSRKHGSHSSSNDWQGALMSIQRGLRLMYVHAYQSFVWNQIAAKRRDLFGNKVVEGDLVVIGEKDEAAPVADKTDQDGELVIQPSSGEAREDGPFIRARPLSKEEAESGKWDIFDIVLPLPGWDVLYPSNATGKLYEEIMASAEGGALDPHQMRRTWKDISLSGGYRKMMARPLNGVEVEVMKYTGEEQLIPTDVDRLLGTDIGTSGDGDGIAVIVKFQLGSSQYATIALRELTKGLALPYKPEFSANR